VVISGAAVGSDAVYAVFPDNTLRALTLTDGSLRWRSRLNAAVNPTGTPVVTDDAVYVLDLFGQISRFDPANGTRVWDYAINDPVIRGAPVKAGGYVMAATGKGRLAVIDPATGHLVWESGTSGSLLRGLTPTQDVIVAVRGGSDAGLVAFEHDESGVLVDVVSPTVFDAGTFTRNFALAAAGFLVVTGLVGRALSARMGPAFIMEDDDGGEEPVDPWDADDDEDLT
jgi:outer membrane protein assembly factor BamB